MRHCRPITSAKPVRAAQFQSLNELAALFAQILGFPTIVLQNFNLLITVLTGFQNLTNMKAPDETG